MTINPTFITLLPKIGHTCPPKPYNNLPPPQLPPVVSIGNNSELNTTHVLINMAAHQSMRSQYALQRACITITNMGITVHHL